jgi:hypothetical protein
VFGVPVRRFGSDCANSYRRELPSSGVVPDYTVAIGSREFICTILCFSYQKLVQSVQNIECHASYMYDKHCRSELHRCHAMC